MWGWRGRRWGRNPVPRIGHERHPRSVRRGPEGALHVALATLSSTRRHRRSDAGRMRPCGRRHHSLGSCPTTRRFDGVAVPPRAVVRVRSPVAVVSTSRSRGPHGMCSVGTVDGQVTADSSQDTGPLWLTGPLQGSVWAVAAATLPNGTVVVAGADSKGRVAWWNGLSGELLSDSRSADPAVMRAMIAVMLPDGRIRFVTAGSQGTVQLWDGAQGVTTGGVISSETGNVWSVHGGTDAPWAEGSAVHWWGRRADSPLGW
jgi:hypothetical protein